MRWLLPFLCALLFVPSASGQWVVGTAVEKPDALYDQSFTHSFTSLGDFDDRIDLTECLQPEVSVNNIDAIVTLFDCPDLVTDVSQCTQLQPIRSAEAARATAFPRGFLQARAAALSGPDVSQITVRCLDTLNQKFVIPTGWEAVNPYPSALITECNIFDTSSPHNNQRNSAWDDTDLGFALQTQSPESSWTTYSSSATPCWENDTFDTNRAEFKYVCDQTAIFRMAAQVQSQIEAIPFNRWIHFRVDGVLFGTRQRFGLDLGAATRWNQWHAYAEAEVEKDDIVSLRGSTGAEFNQKIVGTHVEFVQVTNCLNRPTS